METEIRKISKGQRLSDIMDFLPSNAIIQKTLPGIGATYLEITSKRNSIIIEPNVPVIEGKRKKHSNILGVMGGISLQDVKNYLLSDQEYKKIIVTPESYFKVQGAFTQLGINYFDEYFLLIDECERITQDIGYRETIDAPLEDFWKFKNRSFISATPITPTSKDFKEKGFKFFTIKPDFDYKQDIEIFKTHNVLATVKDFFHKSIPDKADIKDCHCYFINSLDMIHCIIKDLDIKEISNIYCSTDGVRKLKTLRYENAYSSINELNKINFFTCRFFSAVDIEVDFQPNITIVTDAVFAPNSMIIPQTEAIQIAGRFRNGIKTFFHITNIDNSLDFKSIDDVKKSIKEQGSAYQTIYTYYKDSATEDTRNAFKQALERMEFAKLLTADKLKLNWFKLENALLDQLIKNTYHDFSSLLDAYDSSAFFNVKYLDLQNYRFTDYKFFRGAGNTKKEIRKEIVNQLDRIGLADNPDDGYEIQYLEYEDALIVNAYKKLGKDFIEKVDYNEKDLRIALIKKAADEGETCLPVMDSILDTFIVGNEYTEKEIKALLTKIYLAFEVNQKAKATELDDYFNLSPRKTIRGGKEKGDKEVKGFTILSAKFNKKNLGQKSISFNTDEKCPGFFI